MQVMFSRYLYEALFYLNMCMAMKITAAKVPKLRMVIKAMCAVDSPDVSSVLTHLVGNTVQINICTSV